MMKSEPISEAEKEELCSQILSDFFRRHQIEDIVLKEHDCTMLDNALLFEYFMEVADAAFRTGGGRAFLAMQEAQELYREANSRSIN